MTVGVEKFVAGVPEGFDDRCIQGVDQTSGFRAGADHGGHFVFQAQHGALALGDADRFKEPVDNPVPESIEGILFPEGEDADQ